MEIFKDNEGKKFEVMNAIDSLVEGTEEGGVDIAEVAKTVGLKKEDAEETIIELAKERKVSIFGGKVSLLIDKSELVGMQIYREGIPEVVMTEELDATPEEIEKLKEMIKQKEEEQKGD